MAKEKRKFNEALKLLTPEFKTSYPKLDKAEQYTENGKAKGPAKFSITMLFDKSKVELKTIAQPIMIAMSEEFGPDQKKWPKNWKKPWRDGDKPYADKKGNKVEPKPEEENMWVVQASTGEDKPPVIISRDGKTRIEATEIYAGCMARAQLTASAYSISSDNNGAKFYLNGVQFIRDGERLGGPSVTFGAIEGDEGDDETSFMEDGLEESDENFDFA